MRIVSLEEKYFNQVIDFSDKYIGKNYFSLDDLKKILTLSKNGNRISSLLAFRGDVLIAIRLTYMPKDWVQSPDLTIHPELWNLKKDECGYFKSLFVAEEYQNEGLGSLLSEMSMKILKESGAKGIITHSWKESPNNSSFIYLTKMGFSPVKEIKKAWAHINYLCSGCNQKPCQCTAIEMVKVL